MGLEEQIIERLIKTGKRITTVESLTGGMVAASLVNVSGASGVFDQGLITYSNEAKHRLAGVPWDILDAYGAVSEQTAKAMAEGGAENASANMCISTTGIAGPTGGTPEKPVGLVYIGCYLDKDVVVRRFVFEGDRARVREQTVRAAFLLALELLK